MKKQRKPRRKRFSNFTLREALAMVAGQRLKKWPLKVSPVQPSAYYQQTMSKLKLHFDLSLSEAAKALWIDMILLEAIDCFEELKIWKEASLQTNTLTGIVDYMVAPTGTIYQSPLLCVVGAKKDKFEQGTAQCLAEMQACRQFNQSIDIDIYGIVTNATAWQFYKLTPENACYEYAEPLELEHILGILQFIFTQCTANTNTKLGG